MKPNLQQMATNPAKFRAELLIERDGRLVRFGSVMDEYQRADFAACDAGWMRAAGHNVPEPVIGRCWLERPRGHSKTSDLAVALTWFLAFSRKMTRAFSGAGDRDQAKLLRDAMAKLVACNPWLAEILEVQSYKVVNIAEGGHPGHGSELSILSADVSSSYGILGEVVTMDEISGWSEGAGEAFWHSLISTAAKRSTCFVQVITNAGRIGTWQHKAREHARQSREWHFNSLDGPQASWINETILAEQKRILPPTVYARLFENRWVSGGDALGADDIRAAINCDSPMLGSEAGWKFVCGLDLGIVRDFSALVILGVNQSTQRVRLALTQAWKPPGGGGQIDLESIKTFVLAMHRRFRFKKLVYDPYQAVLLTSQLQKAGVPCKELPFVGANLNLMASSMLEIFRSRKLDLYDDEDLIRELSELSIVEKSYGYRLEAARTVSRGHSDKATAFAICLPAAIELLQKPRYSLEDWVNAGAL